MLGTEELRDILNGLDGNSPIEFIFMLNNQNQDRLLFKYAFTREIGSRLKDRIIIPFVRGEYADDQETRWNGFSIANIEDVVQYDPATNPDRATIFFLSQNALFPEEGNPRTAGNNREQGQNDPLFGRRVDDVNNLDISQIKAYFLRVRIGNYMFSFFRKKLSIHTLKGESIFFSWSERWGLIDNRNLFSFDDKFDGFHVSNSDDPTDDGFYILQKNNFESIFNYTQQLEHRAQESILSLCDRLHILDENINIEGNINRDERIRRHYGAFLDKYTIAKLNKFERDMRPFWEEKAQTLRDRGSTLHHFLSNHCRNFDLRITNDPNEERFRPANKAEFKTLVKLLGDDYLISELTNRKYNSHSKEVIMIIQNQRPN